VLSNQIADRTCWRSEEESWKNDLTLGPMGTSEKGFLKDNFYIHSTEIRAIFIPIFNLTFISG